jgi:hypothetical protein
MSGDVGVAELTTKLGGVILRKAELEDDFEKVYLKVFEKMVEVELTGGENLLEILGEVGG